MAFVIGPECIACGSCSEACPMGAIKEGDGAFVIDAGTCISCGACSESCPMGAIKEG